MLAKVFKMPLEMTSFGPEKVAKNENSYPFMVREVESSLLKLEMTDRVAAPE